MTMACRIATDERFAAAAMLHACLPVGTSRTTS